jgi:hypothetical protein
MNAAVRALGADFKTKKANAEFTGAGAEGGGYQHWPWPVLASACNAQLARATAPEVV